MLLIVKNDKFTHQPNGFWHMTKERAEEITELAVVRGDACVGVYKVQDVLYNEKRGRAVFDIAFDANDFKTKRNMVTLWRVSGGKFGGKGWSAFISWSELL